MSSKYSVSQESSHAHGERSNGDGSTGRDTHRDSGLWSAASLEEVNYIDYGADGDDDDITVHSDGSRAGNKKIKQKNKCNSIKLNSRHMTRVTRCYKHCRHCDSVLVPLPGSSEHKCDKCSWYWLQFGEGLFRVLLWPMIIPLLLQIFADGVACPYLPACPNTTKPESKHVPVLGNTSGTDVCLKGNFNHTVQTDCHLNSSAADIPLWYQWIDLRDLFPNQEPVICHYGGTEEVFSHFKKWALTPPVIDPTCELFGYIGQGESSSCYEAEFVTRRQLEASQSSPVEKRVENSITPNPQNSTSVETPVLKKRDLEEEIEDIGLQEISKRMFVAFTMIYNTTMDATNRESDTPATSNIDVLLYRHSDDNADLVRCAPFGKNCSIEYLTNVIAKTAGPWTPRRENYSDWWMFNDHYFYTDNVCVSMNSTNTDLFSTNDMFAEVLQPFGHRLHITPRPWRYGSSTITITATAFNDTLARQLMREQQAADLSPSSMAQFSPSPSSQLLNETNVEYIDACRRLDAIVNADMAIDNVTVSVVATRRFSILVNETYCYGFVDIWPDVGRMLGWPRMNVSSRSFGMIVLASGFLFQILALLTMMPMVDRLCYRKLILIVSGLASITGVGALLFTCRGPDDYKLAALICVSIAVASSVHSATIDSYLPLLASSDIRLARALELAPAKKRKKVKEKKKKRKSKSDHDSKKESESKNTTRNSDTIARKPLALLRRFMRIQDRLASLSRYRSSQTSILFGLLMATFVWWYSDGTDVSDELAFFAMSPSLESLLLIDPIPGNNSMKHMPFRRIQVDYSVALRFGAYACILAWFISLLPAFFCLKLRWGANTGWTCAKGCCYAPFKRKVANFLFTPFHLLFPFVPMMAWSWARITYFVYYLPLLSQFSWMLLFKCLIAEAFRSFLMVTFVHAQRTVGVRPFDLLCGGVTSVVCTFWGIGLNIRWQRLNKKEAEWVSNDVIRFNILCSLVYFIFAAVRGNVSSGSYISEIWEWYLLCALYGLTSGPVFTYLRSYLSEFIPQGFEGISIGMGMCAELALSLVMPVSLEVAATARLNIAPFTLYPVIFLMGASYIWFMKLRLKDARQEKRMYNQRIQTLDDRRNEYRMALRERKKRDFAARRASKIAEAEKKGKLAAMMESEGPDITKVWKGEAGMDRSDEMRTKRNYARVRQLIQLQFVLPFETHTNINCCTQKTCGDNDCRRKGCFRCEKTTYYWGWWCCLRWKCCKSIFNHLRREKELSKTRKDLQNWKKDIAVVAFMKNLYIYQELVQQGCWLSLRWRTEWLKRNFFDDENTPLIVRKERDRRKDAWEERARLNEQAHAEREDRWKREADENWLFAEKPTFQERKKWGLALFDRKSSSEDDSTSDSSEGSEIESEDG